ncbi:MAG TPA: response regulator [Chloroflexota bacterium]
MTRIAIVNDDTVFLDMMGAVLRDRGWETMELREGHTAFAALKDDLPDLIILDIRLEEPETGWTLLELLTLERRTRSIPVIVCSAALLDLRAHEDMLRRYGIRVLPKPFDIDTLYQCVDESLLRA